MSLILTPLGGGFKHFLFSSLLGEMIQFHSYFSDGLKPPTSHPFLPFKIASFQAQSSEEVEVGPGITWPSSGPLNLKEVVKDWVHKGLLKGEGSNGVLEVCRRLYSKYIYIVYLMINI